MTATRNLQRLSIEWLGPFSWPKFEAYTGLPSLPIEAGVYLHTYPHPDGFLIYGAGLTRRLFGTRHREHTRKYRSGDYTVLDIEAIYEGRRQEVWHGWGWTPEKTAEFAARQAEIGVAVERQLKACRIFVAPLGAAPRLLERIEASIMASLYAQPSPVSTIPDRGMQLSARWPDEEPILVSNISGEPIFGLLPELEV